MQTENKELILPGSSRLHKVAYWIVTGLTAALMFGGGIGELTHRWGTLETHTVLGYPVYFLTIIGIWKILGALVILLPGFPRLKEWAYAGMFFNVSGAFVSLIYSGYYGTGGFRLIATGFILLFIIASWILQPLNRRIDLLKQ